MMKAILIVMVLVVGSAAEAKNGILEKDVCFAGYLGAFRVETYIAPGVYGIQTRLQLRPVQIGVLILKNKKMTLREGSMVPMWIKFTGSNQIKSPTGFPTTVGKFEECD